MYMNKAGISRKKEQSRDNNSSSFARKGRKEKIEVNKTKAMQ